MTDQPALRFPGVHVAARGDKPAVIMAGSGEQLTYAELDAFAWRFARALRRLGLQVGDNVALVLENRVEYPALQWGAHYAGLYYTLISSRLTAGEAAHIVGDCAAGVVVVSAATGPALLDALAALPSRPALVDVDGTLEGAQPLHELLEAEEPLPLPGATEGIELLYSSGTTGRPKGVEQPLSGEALGTNLQIADVAAAMFGLDADSVYLSPAPYYHAAPSKFVRAATGVGATAILMERFDAEAALAALDEHRVTHSQWVPTMMLRMLRAADEVKARCDLSAHRAAVHAAAPCPPDLKRAMIDWWGPILHEYYAGTEGAGMTHCTSDEWLVRPGTVGRAIVGEIHVLGGDGRELGPGDVGTIYFSGGREFAYRGDPDKTAEAHAPGGLATFGDVGYVDDEGFLFLTDRRANVIISGGVNIYPQEAEDRLLTHPKVHDAAVIGVPNDEFGEEVRAVVHPADAATADKDLEAELLAYCRQELAPIKCPRAIDFRTDLPREPTGKLLKRKLRDEYWAGRESRLA